jgi:NitT/TauT family transport system permease protein
VSLGTIDTGAGTGAVDTTATLRARPLRDTHLTTLLAPAALGVLTVAAWQLAIEVFDIDPFIVPSPGSIWSEFVDSRSSVWHGMVGTGRNSLYGLLIGAVIGVLGALLANAVRAIDLMALPIVAALSVVPIVALAPALYTMFGAAANTARVIVAALTVIIPVYLNTLRGLRQVKPVHRELMRVYAAPPTFVARAVTLPTATPYVFTGLRIASSLAVISALIAEYFGGPVDGLGKAITTAAASSNYPLAWAFVLGSILLGLAFYVVTLLIELWVARHRGGS